VFVLEGHPDAGSGGGDEAQRHGEHVDFERERRRAMRGGALFVALGGVLVAVRGVFGVAGCGHWGLGGLAALAVFEGGVFVNRGHLRQNGRQGARRAAFMQAKCLKGAGESEEHDGRREQNAEVEVDFADGFHGRGEVGRRRESYAPCWKGSLRHNARNRTDFGLFPREHELDFGLYISLVGYMSGKGN